MDMTEAFRYFGALALVLALVGAAGLAVKRFGIRDRGPGRRMSIVDLLMLGRNHRICIVRCDGVEHVIVTAPQGATLISSGRQTDSTRSSIMKFVRVIPAAMVLMLAAFPSPALAQAAQAAQQALTVDLTGGGQMTERLMQIIGLITILSLAPSILIMMTCFTRIVVVLSLLRTAIGVQQSPPNSVIVSLALFLTFFDGADDSRDQHHGDAAADRGADHHARG
jgi:flagellar biosynthetic protein FliP